MSALVRRLRRIEALAGKGAGRLIVVLMPDEASEDASDALLKAEGIRLTDADLLIRCLSRDSDRTAAPRIERITELA